MEEEEAKSRAKSIGSRCIAQRATVLQSEHGASPSTARLNLGVAGALLSTLRRHKMRP